MALYVMLTKLTPEGSKSLMTAPDRIREVNQEVLEFGCKLIGQYALVGPYDFLNLVEAPDNETVAVLSASLSSRGTIEALTMPALNVGDLLGRLKAVRAGQH
jgi:uncharacterized protein with GYD domain